MTSTAPRNSLCSSEQSAFQSITSVPERPPLPAIENALMHIKNRPVFALSHSRSCLTAALRRHAVILQRAFRLVANHLKSALKQLHPRTSEARDICSSPHGFKSDFP